MDSKILVMGVGNTFRLDDGIGCEIIKILRLENISNAVFIDGGTDGLSLLDQISEYSRVIIIDAVKMQEQPGVIKVFTPDEAKIKIKNDVLSTHGFGLAEVLRLVEKLNIKSNIIIIGIQPKDIGFGEGLSDELKNQIPKILELIKNMLL